MEDDEILGTFYQNPYFDDVFGIRQSDYPIPTKQTRNKDRIKEFKKRVVDMLIAKEVNPNWPYTGKLLVMVSISCPERYVLKVDVDNFQKILFDIFKGIVFKDDSQIFYSLASKHVHPLKMIGFMVGIRKMDVNEYPDYWPFLFSSNPDHWKEERDAKFGKL